jgi:hypothetical protein
MAVKKGLGLMKSTGTANSNQLIRFVDNEKKQLRFLDEASEIVVAYVHFVKTPKKIGYVLCLGGRSTCPLCGVGEPGMKNPVSLAQKVFFARVIERGAPDVAKILKGTGGMSDTLQADNEANGTIIHKDYSVIRKKEPRGKGTITTYSMSGMDSTNRPLSEEEKELGKSVELDVFLESLTNSAGDMEEWIKDLDGKAASQKVEGSPAAEEEEELPF